MKNFTVIVEDGIGLDRSISAECDTLDEARAHIEKEMLPHSEGKRYFIARPIFEAKVNPATLSLVSVALDEK